MNGVFSTFFSVVLVIAASVSAVPISDEVDQVPPLPAAEAKDDGSTDLKPPPPPSSDDSQYSGSSTTSTETLVFDPSGIYSGLLPSGIPGYPDPFPGGYPQPYPGYPQHHPQHPPPGYPSPYVVQTGYEGFLMPSAPAGQSVQTDSLGFLQGIVPSTMLSWMMRSMAVVMGTVTMVIMGGALTTVVCSLTPICSVSFKSLKFLNWNETARSVGMIVGNEMTPERVRRAANFVHQAIKKYSELQRAFAIDDNTADVKN
ncbi:uncharacterized protein LOC129939881 [Eupeodes corollae]|uniref:uncharacterized protein LOC129939881 n=1 Tax=Eupeodes corollae TaxID=290404 RepID=UPI002492F09F|nr:uncharacterized protein LOC129939881 [Eupeodes corollae]